MSFGFYSLHQSFVNYAHSLRDCFHYERYVTPFCFGIDTNESFYIYSIIIEHLKKSVRVLEVFAYTTVFSHKLP